MAVSVSTVHLRVWNKELCRRFWICNPRQSDCLWPLRATEQWKQCGWKFKERGGAEDGGKLHMFSAFFILHMKMRVNICVKKKGGGAAGMAWTVQDTDAVVLHVTPLDSGTPACYLKSHAGPGCGLAQGKQAKAAYRGIFLTATWRHPCVKGACGPSR